EQAREAAERKLAAERRAALQREEEEMQRRMQEQAAATEAARIRAQQAAALRAAEVNSIVARYRDMISTKIRGNTRLPPNLQGNPEVEYSVRLLPTGEIVAITLNKGSGIAAYDEAVRRGIERSSPLPLPTDREAAARFRSLEIRHRAHE
ncbi:MAG: cell envelope integrity protein TolA, partial [Pseudomonadota bacterium]